jgi:hypothetical protein
MQLSLCLMLQQRPSLSSSLSSSSSIQQHRWSLWTLLCVLLFFFFDSHDRPIDDDTNNNDSSLATTTTFHTSTNAFILVSTTTPSISRLSRNNNNNYDNCKRRIKQKRGDRWTAKMTFINRNDGDEDDGTVTRISNTRNRTTIFSGEPSERAQQLDHRGILSHSVVYTPGSSTTISSSGPNSSLSSRAVPMNDLLQIAPSSSTSSSTTTTNIVVFLRSLG